MANCMRCQEKSDLICKNCNYLIDGVVLQKRLESSKPVSVKSAEGEVYPGNIFMVSPVGLGIEVRMAASDYYIVKVDNSLLIKVSRIRNRGKNGCHGFDIVEVIRAKGSSSVRLNSDEYLYLTSGFKNVLPGEDVSLPDNVRDIALERKNRELKKARVYEMLQVGQMYNYQNGFFKAVSSEKGASPLPKQRLEAFANRCSDIGLPCREVVYSEEDKVFDIHGIPVGKQNVGVLVLDVTGLVQQERELRRKETQIYREALQAVTGGKFILVGRDEIGGYIPGGEPLIDTAIYSLADIEFIKDSVKELLADRAVLPNKTFMVLVCLSEALNNIIEHAKGGRCRIFLTPTGIISEISDAGNGINFSSVPQNENKHCFSGSKFLGSGLTYILKCLDKMIMCTDNDGTRLILEKEDLFSNN